MPRIASITSYTGPRNNKRPPVARRGRLLQGMEMRKGPWGDPIRPGDAIGSCRQFDRKLNSARPPRRVPRLRATPRYPRRMSGRSAMAITLRLANCSRAPPPGSREIRRLPVGRPLRAENSVTGFGCEKYVRRLWAEYGDFRAPRLAVFSSGTRSSRVAAVLCQESRCGPPALPHPGSSQAPCLCGQTTLGG